MEFCSEAGADQYDAVVRAGRRLLVALDFDGTLSPLVDNPDVAHIHRDAGEVLDALAAEVRTIAVVTGRPARQVLALGGLDEVGDAISDHGRELVVLGQYGNERWTSEKRRVVTPKPPPGLSGLIRDLPRLLRGAGVPDAWIEEKGLAVAVHTRRLDDPGAAFDRLLPVLSAAAAEKGLAVEPGRYVIEIRAAGMDKGIALRSLVSEFEAGAVVFVGDDLGDVPAFEAVLKMRATGLPALLVSSGTDERSELRRMSDLEVPGPDGVMEFLRELARSVAAAHVSK
ncbi:MAG: trehalose 6-phosphatase [Nocardioidaceae bacterium]|nr:trehalose 6-phosphatase [Nocardioidaceae bacterium]